MIPVGQHGSQLCQELSIFKCIQRLQRFFILFFDPCITI